MLQGQHESCWGLTRAAVSAFCAAPFPSLQCSRKVILCWKLEVGGRRSKVFSHGLMFREKQCFVCHPEGLGRLEKWANGNLLMKFTKAKCRSREGGAVFHVPFGIQSGEMGVCDLTYMKGPQGTSYFMF